MPTEATDKGESGAGTGELRRPGPGVSRRPGPGESRRPGPGESRRPGPGERGGQGRRLLSCMVMSSCQLPFFIKSRHHFLQK